jgi:hypothetical protein
MTIRMLAGALALSAVLAGGPARAEVAVGESAPDFGAREFINTEPLTFTELKGRLILLELFSTT